MACMPVFAQQGKDGSRTINGTEIINEYAAVTGGTNSGSTTVNVVSSTLNNNGRFSGPLQAGDLVMIIQMQGASIQGNTNDPDQWGSITDYNGAGSYEIREVQSIPNGNSIEFTCGLEGTYNTNGNVQIVRIPRLDDLTINNGGNLTSNAWNGNSGGIVALEVSGNLTINAGGKIDVTGLGFRGGQAENNSGDPVVLTANPAYTDATQGAEKGESIAGWGPEYDALGGRYGRGAPANGGGGGNNHNAGGGGGANAGVVADWTGMGNPDPAYNGAWALESPSIAGTTSSGGGRGGYTFSLDNEDPFSVPPGDARWGFGTLRFNVGGLGGRPLDYDSQERLFFGGGGGAGDGNDGGANRGGNGGGMVVIQGAGSISGNGEIIADGEVGESTTGGGNDAPGGGGGGGAIKIEMQGSVDNVTISARGGEGGNQFIEASFADEGEGPGGGGGGGYMSVSAGSAATNASGGEAGTTDQSVFNSFPVNGATDGGSGTSETATVWDYEPTDDEICEGETATLTVSSTGTPPNPITYNWYDAEVGGNLLHTGTSYTTPPLTSDQTYYVGPCPGTYRKPAEVTVNENPEVTIVDDEICDGESVTLTATAAMDTYNWSTGASTQQVIVNTNGQYSVTITDANGCTDRDTMTLTVNPLPTFTLNDVTGCPPLSETMTGPAGMTDYLWSNGASTSAITVTADGGYSLTVTDANDCVFDDDATATESAALNPVLNDAAICDGETHTFNPGTFDFYLWNDASTDGTIDASADGTYAVTVSSTDGCEGTASATLTINTNPTVTIDDATICSDETHTIDPGVYDDYTWSTGVSTATIDVNTAGNYSLTIEDVNGCTATDDMILTVNNTPDFNLVDGTICADENYTGSGPGGMTNYLWSNGTTTRNATVNTAGTYTLTVTDGNTCTAVNSFDLTVNPLPNPVMADQAICDGESTSFTPGTYADYDWNTGLGISTLTTGTAGTYTVTVTDGNSCVNSVSATLTVNPNPVPVLTDAAICDDENITLSPLAGMQTYAWSNGAATDEITVNTADTYAVTVTSADNCTGTAAMDLTVNASPTITVDDGEICQGETFTVTGPAGYAAYLWSNGSPNPNFDWGANANFNLTVTDDNGCTGEDGMTLTVNPLPTPTLADAEICDGDAHEFDPGNYAAYVWQDASIGATYSATNTGTYSVTVTDVNDCVASTSADLTVNDNPVINLTDQSHCIGDQTTITPGLIYDAYIWNTGATTNSITTSDAGNYSVTVTNADGCTDADDMNLAVNTNVTFDIPDAAVCDGESYTIDGPTNMSTYLWSTGATTASIDVTAAATYSLSVTSQSGCPGEDDMTFSLNPLPTPALVDGEICAGETYTFTPAAYDAYLWSNGSFGSTFDATTTGTYGLTVTDNNNCQGETTGDLLVRNNPIISLDDQTICPEGNATFSPGNGFAAYTWSNAATTNSISVNAIGTYAVTIEDANGCEGQASADLTHFTSPSPTLDDATICADESHQFSVTPTFNGYEWSSGSQGQTYSTSTAGNYTVTVTDDNGCVGSVTAALTVNPLPIVTTSADAIVCGGDSTQLTANGGLSYAWAPAGSLNTPDQASTWAHPLMPTTYTVTATDVNGCQATASIQITLSPTGVTVGPDRIVCPGETTTLSASGGVDYVWEPAASLASNTGDNVDATPNDTTAYYVTVTDINGCFQVDSIVVNTYAEPNPKLRDTTICTGESITITPGTFALYLWDNDQLSPTLTISDIGDYSVTVTSDDGCTARDTMTLSLYDLPNVTTTDDAEICPGETSTMIASGAFEYVWNSDPSLPDNIGSLVVAEPSANTTYTVTGTDQNGCQNTASVTITVLEQSVATIEPAGPYCPDDMPIVLIGSDDDGVWSGDGILNPNDGIFAPQVAGTGTHVITFSIPSSCPDETTIDIIVEEMKDPTITPADPLCENASEIDLVAADEDGTWTGDGITDPALGLFDPSQAGEGTHTITFETNSACPRTDEISIDVLDVPDPQINVIEPVCSDTIVLDLTASIAGGTWSGEIIENGNTIVPSPEIVGNHDITYTVTNELGCVGIDIETFNVVLAPVVSLTPEGPLCVTEDAINLSGGTPGGIWSGVGITDASAGIFNPGNASAGDHVVTYTVSNGGQCARSDEMTIQVDPLYTPKIANAGPYCSDDAPDTLTVSASAQGYWRGTGIIDSLNGAFDPATAGPGKWDVSYYIPGTCRSNDMISVSVNPQPQPMITGKNFFCTEEDAYAFTVDVDGGKWAGLDDDGNFFPSDVGAGLYDISYTVIVNGCTGYDEMALEVQEVSVSTVEIGKVCSKNPNNLYPIVAEAEGDVSYAWSTGEIGPGISVNRGGTYTVTVTDISGCTAQSSTTVIDDCNCNLWLPNAFTPDGDDLNDSFRAYGVAPINFNMRIYDRWGVQIFESENMEDAWDGKYQEVYVTPDVYTVKIECDIGGRQIDKVTVVR